MLFARRKLVVLVAIIVSALVFAAAVLAHEGREVGEYELHFGWREEPAIAGLFNGPEVYVSLHGSEEDAAFPEDIEVNLQAEVTFGDQSKVVQLRKAWGETGHYIAELIPTVPGDYVFHVTGTIGETAVDEVWNSADGGFSSVEPVSDIQFPVVEDARIAALEARIAELEAAIAELKGQ